MKLTFPLSTAFGAMLLGTTIAAAPLSAQDLEDLRLRLAWIAGGVDAAFFVADEKGYFAEAGLDVEIVDGNGSTGTIQAVGNGDFDIGIAGLGALAQARQASGATDLIAIAGLVQKDPTSIISLEGSGIRTPKDIEGKRLGTDAGNLEDGMIRAFAEANGVDMDKIEIVVINGGADRVALLKGDVDFINGWANPDGDKVAAIRPIEPPLLFADHGVNILGSSVIVKKDFLATHEAEMTGFLAAIAKAKADVDADPEAARDIFMDHRPDADPEAILMQIKTMAKYEHTAATEGKSYGVLAPEDIELTISLLEKYSGMAPGLTPDDLYSAAYLSAED
ncbi:ABC transporter substrate-binding protein [Celeribacter indicus]|uniref:Thiamine pyrimidine synthase n=1 Tax=Celeribacter indicus TaxID=1208324 RepID=A0A0B5E2G8_9RHOB|nr:ABC transporter substrate-binding protein [Celeribacter indicus]AJE47585.1 putative ABC transporter substrate binding protein [Celeribacter indicus]SDW11035.1 NitT/TauT family transport system substrate-binding protein [Celeribacter indicus]